MKYIMFVGNEFVLIPDSQSHKDFASFNPISAGFCRIKPNNNPSGSKKFNVSCYGTSVSLGLSSRPAEDSLIISIALNNSL